MEKIYAKALKRGDKIGVCSPSNILKDSEDLLEFEKAKKQLEELGFEIVISKHAFDEKYYGNPKDKAEDINNFFMDKDIKAIFSITGGNNSNSIYPYLNYDIIRENPKIICGFSDTTSILNVIHEKTGLITYSGPSFKSLATGTTNYRMNRFIEGFMNKRKDLLVEDDINELKVIRSGTAVGDLVGGNLSLTKDLISGNYKVDFKDKILFLEELIYESPAEKVIHDLHHLKHNNIFDEIAGIWLGNYESEIPLEDLLLEVLEDVEFNKPIIKTNNFGHSEKKMIIPIGATAKNEDSKIFLTGEFIH